jgi:hypothetical protein
VTEPTYLLPHALLRSWQRVGLCESAATFSKARLWCQLPGGHTEPHRHDEITWTEEDDRFVAAAPHDND